ncbi:sigma-70 family RNA polymerase sigma factor [Sinomicrobium sp. FJxs]|uniref:Sigma-70 family RNA polymerase sigma factor n=2 Tax=Sinomicrobium weinanense TaxID=2842200 RepID=A0A926JS86_9FLAO|nr:sigma-70 family RNA polymerase sigma factor [Sinomicrobium weinanense]MBU3123063.1 sigma-70 family RNA polymerase sigma factor [Sinomicrobium weinanense]
MEEKFMELIGQNQKIIHKVVNLYVEKEPDKKDLFQEILYQAWSSFSNFKGNSKFSTWLYRVAMNTAITHVKKRKKNNNARLFETGYRYISEEDEARKRQIDILYRIINKLSPVDKALVLLYIDNHSYEEMSEILGISVSNVGVKINRIKQFLKKEAGKY